MCVTVRVNQTSLNVAEIDHYKQVHNVSELKVLISKNNESHSKMKFSWYLEFILKWISVGRLHLLPIHRRNKQFIFRSFKKSLGLNWNLMAKANSKLTKDWGIHCIFKRHELRNKQTFGIVKSVTFHLQGKAGSLKNTSLQISLQPLPTRT